MNLLLDTHTLLWWLGGDRRLGRRAAASIAEPRNLVWVSAATAWENARTIAAGIRVPAALGDFLILEALRESGGFALAVSDSAIEAARQQVGLRDGLLLSPEGAATYAAYLEAAAGGRIRASDHVVLFNCASGLKYPMPPVTARMDVRAPFAGGISLPSPGS